ncbi:hypothetical protein KUTeg_014922, partial [Tegillarca granosa]
MCLPKNPDWAKYQDSDDKSNSAKIYGTEYETHSHTVGETLDKSLAQYETECFPEWQLEYRGYLMSDHTTHSASEYICVDAHTEHIGSKSDLNGRLLYPVEAACGSLKCPPYVLQRMLDGEELRVLETDSLQEIDMILAIMLVLPITCDCLKILTGLNIRTLTTSRVLQRYTEQRKTVCFPEWQLEYRGYLMSDYTTHSASEYICVDAHPEHIGSKSDLNGRLLYPVEAACGSLKCPPYVNNRELT